MDLAPVDTPHNRARTHPLAALAVAGALLTGCASLPDDGSDTSVMRLDDLRALRYCEVILIGGDAVAQDLRAALYNTTDLNNSWNPRDTCPAALWDKLDTEAIKHQFEVLDVLKNGPRYWVMDWIELPLGTERDFSGLRARWADEVPLLRGVDLHEKGANAYRPTRVERRSAKGFAKGQPVFFLEGPDGMPWVMQAYANTVDPNLTYADLPNLGSRLKLPPGWKYRFKVLDKELTIRAVEGHARIVHDDLDNTYDACFETACSFKP